MSLAPSTGPWRDRSRTGLRLRVRHRNLGTHAGGRRDWGDKNTQSGDHLCFTQPHAGVTLDAAGNVFGTTISGGAINLTACKGDAISNQTPGCGTVFKLTQQAQAPWPESVLYAFRGGKDGALPRSELTVDVDGSVNGSTVAGGTLTGVCALKDGIGWAVGCGAISL